MQIVRAGFDAILTGGNTLRNDNPRMNARVDFEVNQPQKILLTSQEINKESNFFKSGDVIINRSSDLNKVITELSNTEINSILVEAGPNLVNAFLDNNLVDEIIIYKSNITLGDEGVSWFENKTIESNDSNTSGKSGSSDASMIEHDFELSILIAYIDTIWTKYDTDRNGSISVDETKQLLSDITGHKSISRKECEQFVKSLNEPQDKMKDHESDNKIEKEEFIFFVDDLSLIHI